MKLSVKDRIVITQFFKSEGNEETILLQRSIGEKVEFTPEENEKYEIKVDKQTGSISWESDNAEDVDINLSVKEIAYLESRREALNNEEKLNLNIIDLALKIKEEAN